MDQKLATIKKFFSKKETADYIYMTLFFLFSTLFAFLAIKPSLTIAFSLKKEAEDLKKINLLYEKNIESIIKIQSQLESVRSKTFLLEAAIPKNPEPKIIIDNVLNATTQSAVTMEPFDMPAIDIKRNAQTNTLKSLPLSLSIEGDYQSLNNLIQELIAVRRLIVIKSLDIGKSDGVSSGSAQLKSTMMIENYFL